MEGAWCLDPQPGGSQHLAQPRLDNSPSQALGPRDVARGEAEGSRVGLEEILTALTPWEALPPRVQVWPRELEPRGGGQGLGLGLMASIALSRLL